MTESPDTLPKTRKEAMAIGVGKYFTGRPCCRGHIDARYVSGGCVTCTTARAEEWHAGNPEKAKEKDRRWYAAHPDKVKAKTLRRYSPENRERSLTLARALRAKNPEKSMDACRRWRAANPGKQAEATRRWESNNAEHVKAWQEKRRLENPERIREISRKSYQKHRDKAFARARRRRAMKLGSKEHYTSAQLRSLREKSKKCPYCLTPLSKTKPSVDHIIALTKGGTDGIRNIQFTCLSCNIKKNARDPIEYAQSIGLLL